MTSLAFVFPGQGTQHVGMGLQFIRRSRAAADVFATASEVVGYDVARLCGRSSETTLRATAHAQVAVTTCNLAALALTAELGLTPGIVAGHSVGEISALVAAGVLDVRSGVAVAARRGQLMGDVAVPGGMVSVIGAPIAVVRDWCETYGLTIAVINGQADVVVSGPPGATAQLLRRAGSEGARARALAVSHAFHSSLMAGCVPEWETFVERLPLAAPTCPVVPNATGARTNDVATIRRALREQILAPVRWCETMTGIVAHGVDTVVEVGDSRFLTRLLGRTVPDISAVSVQHAPTFSRLVDTRRPVDVLQ